jgi:hypothetical protein
VAFEILRNYLTEGADYCIQVDPDVEERLKAKIQRFE